MIETDEELEQAIDRLTKHAEKIKGIKCEMLVPDLIAIYQEILALREVARACQKLTVIPLRDAMQEIRVMVNRWDRETK